LVVDDRHEQVLLRVHDSATDVWAAEALFDRSVTMYLAGGWWRFCRLHEIMAGHFIVFNYDGEQTITVTVFVETMCRHYYMPSLANIAVSSSSDNE
jgi:hypothetical protein